MDALERAVMSATDDDVKKREVERFAGYAEAAWKSVTGLEPSFVEVLKVDPPTVSNPKVVVMVDGIKIVAYQEYAAVKSNGFQLWDIAETFTGYGFKHLSAPDLSLAGLLPYLKRRRRRLKKRGLYNV